MERNGKARAFERDRLLHDFSGAGIGFKLVGAPLARDRQLFALDIVQLDIRSSPTFGEYVRIWPGAADNQIAVVATDPKRRQLVLRVKEARRPYTELVRRWRREQLPADAVILHRSKEGVLVQHWTPSIDRRYLCGLDDVRLFVTEVPGASSVLDAHARLKPRRVLQAEAGSLPIHRQGEWFFVPPLDGELEDIARQLATDPWATRYDHPVGLGAPDREHRADEVIVLRPGHRREARFARGVVRHLDHRPLRLPGLFRVVRNTTPQTQRIDPRVRWID